MPHSPLRVLTLHFFRRFFDRDTAATEGDPVTTVVRAAAAVTAPGLILAFFLQNQYPGRSLWGAIIDQYLFVLLPIVAMGAVATVHWEMLFPDRLDFLVLTPLSLKPRQLLAGKALALTAFLCLFLLSANVFSTILLPAVSKGPFLRHLWAHAVATTLAGLFAALTLLALGGTMLCTLHPRRFRLASPLLQALSVVVLTLSLLHYLRYGNSLPTILAGPLGLARWYPPFWFLAVYELLLRGPDAPAFAHQLAPYAYRALLVALALVLVTYPAAWQRMQQTVLEGAATHAHSPWRWSARLLERLIPTPAERAVFAFVGQTLARTTRYQAYLALYGGLGLALAIACAAEVRKQGHTMTLAFSNTGLYAVLPLLLFWVVAGLRSAFALPLSLDAAWIFRLSGAHVAQCTAAARLWSLALTQTLTLAVALLTLIAGWTPWQALIQLGFGAALGLLLTDAFFPSNDTIPFTRPRTPGLTNFPLTLTLFVGILPLYVIGAARLEARLELTALRLPVLLLGAILIHAGAVRLRHVPTIVQEDLEGYDEQFQLLNLR